MKKLARRSPAAVLLVVTSAFAISCVSTIPQNAPAPASTPGAPLADMIGGIPTSDNTFAASQRNLVRTPDGSLYLAYVKSIDGFDQIYVARSRDQGRSWSDFPQISAGASKSSNPDLVSDARGHLTVIWTKQAVLSQKDAEANEGRKSAIVGAGEMSGGGPPPTGRELQQALGPGKESPGTSSSDVENASEKSAEISAEHLEQGGKGDQDDEHMRQIYWAVFDGRRWSPQRQLTEGEYNGFPSAAYDSAGVLHMVWYGFDGHFYQVVYSYLKGGVWSHPDQISVGYPDSVNPSIVVDSRNNLHVAWYKFAPATKSYQIDYRRYDAATGMWGEQAQLSYGLYNAMNVSMVLDSLDRLYLTYDGLRTKDGGAGVFLRRRTAGGWETQLQIAPDSANASLPTITRDPLSRTIYLFYQSAADGNVHLVTANEAAEPLAFSPPRIVTPSFVTTTKPNAESSDTTSEFPNARWSAYDYPFSGPNAVIDLVWTEKNALPDYPHGHNLIRYAGIPGRP